MCDPNYFFNAKNDWDFFIDFFVILLNADVKQLMWQGCTVQKIRFGG